MMVSGRTKYLTINFLVLVLLFVPIKCEEPGEELSTAPSKRGIIDSIKDLIKDKTTSQLPIDLPTIEVPLDENEQEIQTSTSETSKDVSLEVTTQVLSISESEEVLSSSEQSSDDNELDDEDVYSCPIDREIPCIPKCCDVGQSFSSEKKCAPSTEIFRPEFVDCPRYAESAAEKPEKEWYEYFIGDPCIGGKYMLVPEEYDEDNFTLFTNGSLWFNEKLHTMSEYCMENVEGVTRAFACFNEPLSKGTTFQYVLYPIGLLTSVPFLLMTAAIFLGIPDLRDTQGKVLSCHVLCLAVGYFFLALTQLASDTMNEQLCIAAGFTIQFFFVAAFFWLNIMCFDTWRNIQTDSTSIISSAQSSNRKKFVLYSMYAWYGPCFLLIVSLVMDLEPDIPDSFIKPHFGSHSCWFNSDTAAFPYFYLPLGILICVNVVFFILSLRRVWKLEHDLASTQLLQHSISVEERSNNISSKLGINKKSLKRCILLFSVMGINWVAEILSWALGGPIYIWIITDVFNSLQGLLIFYIFILRQEKVRNLVKDYWDSMLESKQLRKCRRKERDAESGEDSD